MNKENEVNPLKSAENARVLAQQAREWIASEQGQNAIRGALDQAAQTACEEAGKEIKPESLHTPVTL